MLRPQRGRRYGTGNRSIARRPRHFMRHVGHFFGWPGMACRAENIAYRGHESGRSGRSARHGIIASSRANGNAARRGSVAVTSTSLGLETAAYRLAAAAAGTKRVTSRNNGVVSVCRMLFVRHSCGAVLIDVFCSGIGMKAPNAWPMMLACHQEAVFVSCESGMRMRLRPVARSEAAVGSMGDTAIIEPPRNGNLIWRGGTAGLAIACLGVIAADGRRAL